LHAALVVHDATARSHCKRCATDAYALRHARRHRQAVRALLLYGADATLRDGRGSCCLLLAVNRNDAEGCKALLAALADPCEEAKNGLSVLEYARRRNRLELAGMMQTYLEASGLDMDEVPSYAPYAPQPVKAPLREWSSRCSDVWPEQRLSQASLSTTRGYMLPGHLGSRLADEWPGQRSQQSLSSGSMTPRGSRLALGSQLSRGSLSSIRTPRSPSSTRGDRLAVADILELRAHRQFQLGRHCKLSPFAQTTVGLSAFLLLGIRLRRQPRVGSPQSQEEGTETGAVFLREALAIAS